MLLSKLKTVAVLMVLVMVTAGGGPLPRQIAAGQPNDPKKESEPLNPKYVRLSTVDSTGHAFLRNLLVAERETRLSAKPGFDKFRIQEEASKKILAAVVLRVDQRDVYFQIDDKVFGIHIGQTIDEAMRKTLSDADLENLKVKRRGPADAKNNQPPGKAPEQPPSKGEIPDLVKMLGSTTFTERNAAAKRLELMQEAELELFRKLDFSADLEIKRRANIIIGQIDGRLNAERFDKVFADWQNRQHWFEAVEYHVEGRHKVPKDSYTRIAGGGGIGFGGGIGGGPKPNAVKWAIPDGDLEGEVSFAILLDLAKGRHRRSTLDQSFHLNDAKLNPTVLADIFDGAVMKCLIPKEKNLARYGNGIDMTIVSGNMRNGAFSMPFYPIFFSQGRICSETEPIVPGQLRNQPARENLYVYGKGTHEGRECLILRTKSLVSLVPSCSEYWVDLGRESAIVRYCLVSNDRPDAEINLRYQESHGHWLLDSWRWTAFMRGEPLYMEEMSVKRIVPNPKLTDADFTLATKAGMLIEERTDFFMKNAREMPQSAITVYRLEADGSKTQVRDPYRRKGDTFVP